MNRKGFTLIELLGVIVIVGLVVGLSSFGIIKAYNNSKEKALALTEKNIVNAAEIYANEKISENDYWKEGDSYSYFCATVKELINMGLLKKEKIDKKIINNYAVVMKNKMTFSIDDSTLLPSTIDEVEDSYLEAYNICKGNYIVEEITTEPSLKDSTSYTDSIKVSFEDAVTNSNIVERYCAYGTSSQFLNGKGIVSGNTCDLDGLKNDTNYYIKVCMKTEKNSIICSSTNNYSTQDIIDPDITIGKNVTISYDDTNIKEPYHYFKSTQEATSNVNVKKCTLDNNRFTCNDNGGNNVEKDVWYKVDDNTINISYSTRGNGEIIARTEDKTGNYKENSKEFSNYEITFIKDDEDNPDSIINLLCLAEKGKSCYIKSPNPTRSGFTLFGWNTHNYATTSQWDPNVSKSVNTSEVYFAIWTKTLTIELKDQTTNTAAGTKEISDARAIKKLIVDNGIISSSFSNNILTYNISSGTSNRSRNNNNTSIVDPSISSATVPSNVTCKDGTKPDSSGVCPASIYNRGKGTNYYYYLCENNHYVDNGAYFPEDKVVCDAGDEKGYICEPATYLGKYCTDNPTTRITEPVDCDGWCVYKEYRVEKKCPSGKTKVGEQCYGCNDSRYSLKKIDNQYKCEYNYITTTYYYDYIITVEYFTK